MMKKLSLRNLKVVKISDKEKTTITGGSGAMSEDCMSAPYVSWCHSCTN